jgi:hypothetical protein
VFNPQWGHDFFFVILFTHPNPNVFFSVIDRCMHSEQSTPKPCWSMAVCFDEGRGLRATDTWLNNDPHGL